jgi:predicted glycogen debranching enzyme
VPGTFSKRLSEGHTLTMVLTTESLPDLDEQRALDAERRRQHALHVQADAATAKSDGAGRRSVRRQAETGRSVIASYHWFTDWGRDTMISLPGLTLTTGRASAAADILRTFARYVDEGMLPNNFPTRLACCLEHNAVRNIAALLSARDDDPSAAEFTANAECVRTRFGARFFQEHRM